MATSKSDDIWEIILQHQGKSEAITSREIAGIIGCDTRTVRDAVEYLRGEKGYPIASSSRAPAGYYIPTNPEEVQQSIQQIQSRIRRMTASVQSLEQTLTSMKRSGLSA